MSSRSSQYNSHRAMSTAMRVFLIVFVLGVAKSFSTKPVYQCTEKLLLDSGGNRQTIVDSSNPFSGLFGDENQTIATQIEIMKGDRVASDAYKDADIPPDTVSMNIRQIPGTNVVEIVVEGAQAVYTERFAKTLPNTYLSYATGNRKIEIANALSFARVRLSEENGQLVESEINQERFLVANEKLANTPSYARQLGEKQRDIKVRRSTVDMLIKSVEDLRLRAKMTHDPVLVLSPAKNAELVSPTMTHELIVTCLFGFVIGLLAAGLQLFMGRPKGA